jgi:hypothetical protein
MHRKGIFQTRESESQTDEVVAIRTRWLAVVTGCFTAVAGTFVGGLFFLIPSFLILGAVVQPRSPRSGRWLMWLGAFLLSLMTLPLASVLLSESIPTLRVHYDYGELTLVSLCAMSVFLVIWCDVELVVDAIRMRRGRLALAQRSAGAAEWLVWAAALCLSLMSLPYSVLGVSAYRREGRLDILLFSLASSVFVILFDVALAVDAVKMWHSRRKE